MLMRIATLVLVISLLSACMNTEPASLLTPNQFSKLSLPDTAPPKAKTVPYSSIWHGETLSDPFNWLRDAGYPEVDNPDILNYLNSENQYFSAFMTPHQDLVDRLFTEMKGRLDETEESVPYVMNGYEYRWYYNPGANYRTYTRKKIGAAAEAIFLDQQALAKDSDYFVLRDWAISPDNTLLAYTIDTSGDERYQISIKNLLTGEVQENVIQDSDGSLTFNTDGEFLIFGHLNENRWRTDHVVAYNLKNESTQVLFTELDQEFFLSFYLTSDKEYLLIDVSKGGVSEIHAVSGRDISQKPNLFVSRDNKFQYRVDHAHGKFYILANDSHVNFRLASASDKKPGYQHWQTLIPGSDSVYLKDIKSFKEHLVIMQSEQAFNQIMVWQYDGLPSEVPFNEKMIDISLGENPDFGQNHIRINYSSMTTPHTVFDFNVKHQKLESRKVRNIPDGYDQSLYTTERLMITARDGVNIPVSLLYKKGTPLDGSHPVHLTAYGAYGYSYPTYFSTNRLSLVDRGIIFAIAHIRGGDEMGYQWYLDGKLNKRQNTFSDLIDTARELINLKYGQAKNISISGRSAGGELMGAAVVQAPQLWSAVVLGVPFVDVLNTMLDASLPLTPPEWQEWGNPIESKAVFNLIKSYSPYDNIERRDYPPMMITGGLNDPRVTYWEPAKFTAKMRHLKTDENLLIMRMNMGAGHFANSGRYGKLKDYAQEYAFLLLSHGISE